MPLVFDKKLNNDSRLLLWKIEEELDFFEENCDLSETSFKKYSNFKSERRKKEFLASRLMLQELALSDKNVIYLEDGAPKIIDSQYSAISISHNRNYAAIILGKSKVAVDIESQSEKLEKIRHKFLNDVEFETFNHSSIQCLTILWSAKEALFKYAHFNGIDLKKQLLIDSMDWNTNNLKCRIVDPRCEHQNIEANFLTFDKDVLVYIN